jgi:hypothetical protein
MNLHVLNFMCLQMFAFMNIELQSIVYNCDDDDDDDYDS